MGQIIIPGFKGGLAKEIFGVPRAQTFQTAKDLDIFTRMRTLGPHLGLGADTTDKTRNNIKLDSVIKAADGRIYFKGFDEAGGTVLTIWDASTSLGSSTALTAETVASGAGGGFGIVEFLSDLFYYESSTRIQAFDIGGAAVVTNAIAVNNTCPIFVHEGLKKMFYTVAANQIGGTSTSTISSTALLTFGEDIRPKRMAHWGQFIAIGLNTINNSKNAQIAIWNGSSSTIEDLIDVGDIGLQGIVNLGGHIYIITSSNPAGSAKYSVIRIYRWGGSSVELMWELDLKPTVSNAVSVDAESIKVYKDNLLFGMNALNAGSMTIDNGVYAFNHRSKILTLDRIVSDTSDIRITSINVLDGLPVVTWTDGTNYRINHVPATNAKSSSGVYKSDIFALNNGKMDKIKRILIVHENLPSSCGFTVKVQHFSHYPVGGSVASADSFTSLVTPQGSGGASGVTQSTDNTGYTIIENHDKFKDARFAQLEIDFDEVSGVNSADIVFPIYIDTVSGSDSI